MPIRYDIRTKTVSDIAAFLSPGTGQKKTTRAEQSSLSAGALTSSLSLGRSSSSDAVGTQGFSYIMQQAAQSRRVAEASTNQEASLTADSTAQGLTLAQWQESFGNSAPAMLNLEELSLEDQEKIAQLFGLENLEDGQQNWIFGILEFTQDINPDSVSLEKIAGAGGQFLPLLAMNSTSLAKSLPKNVTENLLVNPQAQGESYLTQETLQGLATQLAQLLTQTAQNTSTAGQDKNNAGSTQILPDGNGSANADLHGLSLEDRQNFPTSISSEDMTPQQALAALFAQFRALSAHSPGSGENAEGVGEGQSTESIGLMQAEGQDDISSAGVVFPLAEDADIQAILAHILGGSGQGVNQGGEEDITARLAAISVEIAKLQNNQAQSDKTLVFAQFATPQKSGKPSSETNAISGVKTTALWAQALQQNVTIGDLGQIAGEAQFSSSLNAPSASAIFHASGESPLQDDVANAQGQVLAAGESVDFLAGAKNIQPQTKPIHSDQSGLVGNSAALEDSTAGNGQNVADLQDLAFSQQKAAAIHKEISADTAGLRTNLGDMQAALKRQETQQQQNGENQKDLDLAGKAADQLLSGKKAVQSIAAQNDGAKYGQDLARSFSELTTADMTANQRSDGLRGGDIGQADAAARGKPGFAAHMSSHEQVMVQIKRHVQAGGGSEKLNIQLYPEELGRVEVQLDFADDGMLRVLVLAEKPEALQNLQRDAHLLERALQQAGLKMDDGAMSFDLRGGHSQTSDQDQGQKSANSSSSLSGDGAGESRDAGEEISRWQGLVPTGRIDLRI